jgi:circadian clock protein KaiB
LRTIPLGLSPLATFPRNRPVSNPPGGSLSAYHLKLYITGTNPRAQIAIRNLQHICEHDLGGRYTLEIIDVLASPEIAEEHRILATPTLVKELPPPLRRVIGDLSDREKVLLGLELHEKPEGRA